LVVNRKNPCLSAWRDRLRVQRRNRNGIAVRAVTDQRAHLEDAAHA
jgi:hypothetical protein